MGSLSLSLSVSLFLSRFLSIPLPISQPQSPQKSRNIRQPTPVPDVNEDPPSFPSAESVGRTADAQSSGGAEDKAKCTRIDALINKAQSVRADALNNSATTADTHMPPQQAQQPPQMVQNEAPLSPQAAEAVSALPGLLASLSSKSESQGKR